MSTPISDSGGGAVGGGAVGGGAVGGGGGVGGVAGGRPGESSRVLQALVAAAVDTTDAAHGWLVVRDGDEICVRAAAGEQAGKLVGARVPAGSGLAGYVLSAGHPIALSSGTDDARLAEGVPSIIGRTPANVLCVPCLDDDVITGALELIDKAGGSGFTFDDVEFATVLAQVAGVALSSHLEAPTSVPDAAALARELERLQAREPLRYVAVATLLTALLSWR